MVHLGLKCRIGQMRQANHQDQRKHPRQYQFHNPAFSTIMLNAQLCSANHHYLSPCLPLYHQKESPEACPVPHSLNQPMSHQVLTTLRNNPVRFCACRCRRSPRHPYILSPNMNIKTTLKILLLANFKNFFRNPPNAVSSLSGRVRYVWYKSTSLFP
jgi:hypothetical protein